MKKRLTVILSLVLCALLLCSCAMPEALAAYADTQRAEDDTPLFSEMEYTRPDIEIITADVEAMLGAMEKRTSYRTLCGMMDQCLDNYYDFNTAYVLSDIHSCLDMTDEYWAEEYSFCMDMEAEVAQLYDRLYYGCAASRHASKLERDYFWEGFCEEYADPEDSAYTDRAVELKQLEAGLLSEYRSIIAAPIITVDGEETDMNSYLESCPPYRYLEIYMNYFRSYNEELSDIYIKLIRTRRELAREMGYESVEAMQAGELFSRDYGHAEAQAYIEDIKKYMVPVFTAISDPPVFSESFTEKELDTVVHSAADRMGEEIAEAYGFLREHELLDMRMDTKKADMSFTTYIDNYNAPFVFIDRNGSGTDLLTLIHELGHATDLYYNCNATESIDLSECFSQSLELLMPSYTDSSLDRAMRKELLAAKLEDMLEIYIQQASFAEFENIVYSLPDGELTAENLNAASLKTAGDFGYLSAGLEEYYSLSWVDIVHFFEYPFYVISYPVSCDVAMQLYALEREEAGAGLAKYRELLPRSSEKIVDSVEAAGLESPFAPGRVEKAAQLLREELLR